MSIACKSSTCKIFSHFFFDSIEFSLCARRAAKCHRDVESRGGTICVTCNKYILHANCISLTGSKLVEARERDPPDLCRDPSSGESSRAPVLAAAQQQAANSHNPLKIHIHNISTSTTRDRDCECGDCCQSVCHCGCSCLPPSSPACLPALLVTGLQTRSQSQSSFCPSLLPHPADPQQAINVAAVAYIVGLWFLPSTDRSQQIAADKLALT